MAEIPPKTAGGQAPNEGATEQPPDSTPADGTGREAANEPEGATADEAPAQSAAEQTEADMTSKGKEKDEPSPAQPAVDKQGEGDSLSIEPSDQPPASAPGSGAEAPVCTITLLLPTGARHPYRIDERYLAKRNVEVPDVTESGRKDPFSISVYKLKELILREWRDEWEGKPASPSSIRLIHFGKLLDDKEQLKSQFSLPFSLSSPHIGGAPQPTLGWKH